MAKTTTILLLLAALFGLAVPGAALAQWGPSGDFEGEKDDEGGSGIRDYTVYVSANDGPCQIWLKNSLETEAAFAGQIGSTYAFYSVATDNVGHREEAPGSFDAYTTVVADVELL